MLRLTKPLYGSNRNITTNNWFSSYELTDELSKKNTIVGTLRNNKSQISPSISIGGPLMSSHFLYQSDQMLISYALKKKSKKYF